MTTSDEKISFTLSKKHLSTVTMTVKTLALTGGLYAFAFLMVPAVLSNDSNEQSLPAFNSDLDDPTWESGITNYWADEPTEGTVGYGPSCTDSSCGLGTDFGSELGTEQIKERVSELFPEFGSALTVSPLGSGALYEVHAHDVNTKFLVSSDGNYLINSGYFDMSNVHSATDVDKLIEIDLGAEGSRGTNTSAANTGVNNTANDAPDVDPDLFKQEAFKWAMEHAQIKYPAFTDDVKGDIVVFADYTCPQCRQFHNDYNIVRSNGYNLHIALLSGSGNQGQIFQTTNSILCSSDPKAHYEDAIRAGRSYRAQGFGNDAGACESPAGDFYDMAIHFMSQEMDRPGTPGIWVNGEYFIDRRSVLSI